MIEEPRIALAASPREWAQRLHRHVADHGGARVRATVLHPHDALEEDYDVFVADDTTSFLTPNLVARLHDIGRAVVGVFDPHDPRGRDDLVALGVDRTLPRDAAPETFLETLAGIATSAAPDGAATDGALSLPTAEAPTDAAGHEAPSGSLVGVAAACGGAGATELAIAIAAAAGPAGTRALLVDADTVAPSVAPRLGLPTYPNLRAAIDAVERRLDDWQDGVHDVADAGFRLLPGATGPGAWQELRPARAIEALHALATTTERVVVDIGARLEDVPTTTGNGRYGLARQITRVADALVVVTTATPVGVARLFDWVAEAAQLAPETPLHVVCNRAPTSTFKRNEVTAEITRTLTPASLWFVPSDPKVEAAAWQGEVVRPGPFTKAVGPCAARILALSRRTETRGGRRRRAA